MTVDNILCILSGNQLLTLRDKSKKILQASYSNLSVILGSFVSHLYDHRWIKAHELVFCVSLLPHPLSLFCFFPVQASSIKEYFVYLDPSWKSTTSRTHLREVPGFCFHYKRCLSTA